MDLRLTNSTDLLMVYQLQQLNSVIARAQSELASGKKVTQASDSPGDVQAILQGQVDLARVQQTQTNLTALNSETNMASTVLDNATKLLDQARSLGVTGASSFSTPAARSILASQIQDMESQFVPMANSTNAGRYIFAGDDDLKAPYSIDFTKTPPYSANTTAQATRLGVNAMGGTFQLSMTATDIFDNADPTKNVLASLESLRQGLLNNDTTAIDTANQNLGTAATQLSDALAFYGNVQNTITSALNTASQMQINLQTQQSNLTDADVAQAIAVEQTAQTQQQAMLQMRAQLPRTSLFSMLG
jgi:flagellar hook-associated protein 3 FlgL